MNNPIKDRYLWILILFIGALSIIKLSLSYGLEYDEAEQALLSQKFLLGYNQQPPLYTWLIIIINALVNNILISNIILKHFLYFGIYFFIYKIAKQQFKQKLFAISASASLVLFFQFSMDSLRYTHTLMLLFSVALTLWVLVQIINNPNIKNYLLLGLILAIGFLSKYNFALSFFAFFFAAIVHKPYRPYVFNYKILFSIVLVVLLTTPHLYWIIENHEKIKAETVQDFNYLQHEGFWFYKFRGFMEYTYRFILLLIPFLVVLTIFINRKIKRLFAYKMQGFLKFIGYTIIFSILLLFILVVVLEMHIVKARWLLPFMILVPVFVFGILSNLEIISRKRLLRLNYTLYFFFASVLIFLILRYNNALTFNYWESINRPTDAFAEYLENEIKLGEQEIDLILSSSVDMGGNLKYYLKSFLIQVLTPDCTNKYGLSLVENPKKIFVFDKPENLNAVLKCIEQKYVSIRITEQQNTFVHVDHYSRKDSSAFRFVIIEIQ